jgi:hypothetical protein
MTDDAAVHITTWNAEEAAADANRHAAKMWNDSIDLYGRVAGEKHLDDACYKPIVQGDAHVNARLFLLWEQSLGEIRLDVSHYIFLAKHGGAWHVISEIFTGKGKSWVSYKSWKNDIKAGRVPAGVALRLGAWQGDERKYFPVPRMKESSTATEAVAPPARRAGGGALDEEMFF